MSKIHKITADRIYNGKGDVLEHHYLIVDEKGEIKALQPLPQIGDGSIEKLDGILVPGFINTHCHLELSHMKGVAPTGTGLVSFIKEVITKREANLEEIKEAIKKADCEMYENGIVAVGDISNVADSFEQKAISPIQYLTFVEMFDFRQEENAKKVFEGYLKIYRTLEEMELKGTLVPHAPYSVSEKLFQLMRDFNQTKDLSISIHNMETQAENDMFLSNSGELISFFEQLGIPTHSFKAIGKASVHYAMPLMDDQKRTILVHNTLCDSEDIEAVLKWNSETYWSTCPSANLYIENRLPRYQNFIETAARMTIGTDSLTSNWSLSILDEMKTIHRYQSFISFDQLIQWACYNGACALGLEQKLGSIELGKKPGINLLQCAAGNKPESLGNSVKVKKVI